MNYIELENDGKTIKNIYCGDFIPDGFLAIPDNFEGFVGDSLDFFNEDLSRKSESQLVKEGLIEMPVGMKWNEDKTEIIQMSEIELYKAGILEIPIGHKIENDKIVEMSLDEQLQSGVITEQRYKEIQIEELKAYLSSTDYVTLKIIEGVATKEDYMDILIQRNEVRLKINELENS